MLFSDGGLSRNRSIALQCVEEFLHRISSAASITETSTNYLNYKGQFIHAFDDAYNSLINPFVNVNNLDSAHPDIIYNEISLNLRVHVNRAVKLVEYFAGKEDTRGQVGCAGESFGTLLSFAEYVMFYKNARPGLWLNVLTKSSRREKDLINQVKTLIRSLRIVKMDTELIESMMKNRTKKLKSQGQINLSVAIQGMWH